MGCMSHQVVGHPLQSIPKNVPVHKSKGKRPKTRKRTAMGCVGKTKAAASKGRNDDTCTRVFEPIFTLSLNALKIE